MESSYQAEWTFLAFFSQIIVCLLFSRDRKNVRIQKPRGESYFFAYAIYAYARN